MSTLTDAELLSRWHKGEWVIDIETIGSQSEVMYLATPADLATFPLKWQEKARIKLHYINWIKPGEIKYNKEIWDALIKEAAVAINDIKPPSAASVHAWWRRYRVTKSITKLLPKNVAGFQQPRDYWFKQMQAGRQLSDIEKTWALEYKEQQADGNRYEYHLRKAASLGCDLALLDLAEKFDESSFFEGDYWNVAADPMSVAEIAQNLGRSKDQYHWLTVAAEAGNIDAMRELIENFDSKDLVRCWTWIYLSQLLEDDLTENRHYAIHENGSSYDDDVGGPMFVDGTDGIELELLEGNQDELAKLAAKSLFNRLELPAK